MEIPYRLAAPVEEKPARQLWVFFRTPPTGPGAVSYGATRHGGSELASAATAVPIH